MSTTMSKSVSGAAIATAVSLLFSVATARLAATGAPSWAAPSSCCDQRPRR